MGCSKSLSALIVRSPDDVASNSAFHHVAAILAHRCRHQMAPSRKSKPPARAEAKALSSINSRVFLDLFKNVAHSWAAKKRETFEKDRWLAVPPHGSCWLSARKAKSETAQVVAEEICFDKKIEGGWLAFRARIKTKLAMIKSPLSVSFLRKCLLAGSVRFVENLMPSEPSKRLTLWPELNETCETCCQPWPLSKNDYHEGGLIFEQILCWAFFFWIRHISFKSEIWFLQEITIQNERRPVLTSFEKKKVQEYWLSKTNFKQKTGMKNFTYGITFLHFVSKIHAAMDTISISHFLMKHPTLNDIVKE